MLYNKTIVDYRGSGYDVIFGPRSIFVFSGRYHIISTASIVNNCIMLHGRVIVMSFSLVDVLLPRSSSN